MKTIENIKYDRAVNFIGRNGYFKQSGIEVYFTGNTNTGKIILQPTTSRGETGRCSVEIPIENVNALIGVLDAMANE